MTTEMAAMSAALAKMATPSTATPPIPEADMIDMTQMMEQMKSQTPDDAFPSPEAFPSPVLSTPAKGSLRTKRATPPRPIFATSEHSFPGDVGTWLRGIGYAKYGQAFEEEEFNTLGAVAEITEEDLHAMGITKRGAVRGLLKHIREIKQREDNSAALRTMSPAMRQLEQRMQQLEEQYDQIDQLSLRVDRLGAMFGELPQQLKESREGVVEQVSHAAEECQDHLQSQITELQKRMGAIRQGGGGGIAAVGLPGVSNSNNWAYVAADGSTIRNQTADQLREAARSGRMKKGNYVWQKGFEAWMPISKVPQLNFTNEDDQNP